MNRNSFEGEGMKLFSLVRTFLAFVFHRPQVEREMEEELRSHIALRADDLERQGLSRAEAERRARIEFGGYERYKEECREALGSRLLGELIADVRYGLRGLRRNPGFTAVAIITLALGVGANTAIFSVVNAVLLRPLPYRDPGRLIYISEFWPHETPVKTVPSPDFANWSEHDRLFEGLAAYGGGAEVNLTSGGEPERLQGARVTADFFGVLGVQPYLGRSFLAEEDRPGGRNVVLLSYEFWHRRFGSDAKIVGSSVQLDGEPYTVVGITPAGFRFPDDDFRAEVFLPMVVARVADWKSPVPEKFRLLRPLARLRPGVSFDEAKAELSALVRGRGRVGAATV